MSKLLNYAVKIFSKKRAGGKIHPLGAAVSPSARLATGLNVDIYQGGVAPLADVTGAIAPVNSAPIRRRLQNMLK